MTHERPYTNLKTTDDYIIREFDANVDHEDLRWHRDDEDRLVEVIGETDWKIQLDNQFPILLNEPIFIPRHQWHRAIKGTGDLKIKINKL